MYVGKAGKTIRERCRQHKGGFNGGSKTGIANAEKIIAEISKGNTIAIYLRHSEQKTLFEVEVSLCEAEEKALIKKFIPPYNRARPL